MYINSIRSKNIKGKWQTNKKILPDNINIQITKKNFSPVINSNIFFGRSKKEHESWGLTFNNDKDINFKMFTFTDAKKVYIEILDDNKNTNTNNVDERDIIVKRNEDDSVDNILPNDNSSRIIELENKGKGVFEAQNIPIYDEQFYRVLVVKNDNVIEKVKDPYSKSQPHILGWSKMRNPNSYTWGDKDWMAGNNPNRITRKNGKLNSLRIYELNIPTITKNGDFESTKEVLKTIKEKNLANAIEIMPVENTYSKQWGYDGVDKFAINEKLGSADKLKSLIDYAHSIDLNIIIDMVPNHMGTDGDMLKRTGPYEKSEGAFGAMLNYEGKDNKYVRDWMTNAALNWALEYHADGIRFDMTKPDYMGSDFTSKQIVAELNEHSPMTFTIAEDGMGNREKITAPITSSGNHIHDIENIDKQVTRVEKGHGIDKLDGIGFDSEWDFVFYHHLNRSLIFPEARDIDELDNAMKHSRHRVKYSSSHDEVGNLDGTSPIVKYATAKLGLAYCVDGTNKAEIGQRAAHATQSLLKAYAEGKLNKMNHNELNKFTRSLNIRKKLTKQEIIDAYDYAFDKAKLATGTLYSTPGPKMYFQGMERGALDYFKFFRKFSSDENPTEETKRIKQKMDIEKGYDTSYEASHQDSIIGNINCTDDVKKKMDSLEKYTKDINDLVSNSETLQYGEIKSTICHSNNRVHAKHITPKNYGGEEYFIVQNFSDTSYPEYGFEFPAGKWVEVINSDDKIYSGKDMTNKNKVFEADKTCKHFIKMSANSVSYFKKVN